MNTKRKLSLLLTITLAPSLPPSLFAETPIPKGVLSYRNSPYVLQTHKVNPGGEETRTYSPLLENAGAHLITLTWNKTVQKLPTRQEDQVNPFGKGTYRGGNFENPEDIVVQLDSTETTNPKSPELSLVRMIQLHNQGTLTATLSFRFPPKTPDLERAEPAPETYFRVLLDNAPELEGNLRDIPIKTLLKEFQNPEPQNP
jgi:hypothetical protein